MPSEVNTREHTQDMVAVHLYNAGETSVALKRATLTFLDGPGMADATDFSNLSTNSFPWFRLPISLERTLEPWEDSVMPTFEAGSFDGSGVWAEVFWRVADDRTLEGDEWVQVRFDFELDDGTVGSYTAQPFVLEDDDRAEISVANAAVFEDEEFAEVVVTAKVIDTDEGRIGSGRGPRNSPQQLAVPIHVDYATGDGTATAGSDYEETEGTLTIIGDERSRSTTIGVISDGEREENERFTVTIFNPEVPITTNFRVLAGGIIVAPNDPPVSTGKASTATVTIIDAASNTEGETPTRLVVTADNTDPSLGDAVRMTASIQNPPEGAPSYQWQRQFAAGWRDTPDRSVAKTVRFRSLGTRTYRVVATYPGGEEIISEALSLTW